MTLVPATGKPDNIFLRMDSIHRFMFGFVAATITFLFIRHLHLPQLLQFMILWDVFSFTILVNAWIVFFTCSPARMRQKAKKEDGSRVFVFIIVLISSLSSMVTVLLLVLSKGSATSTLYVPIAIAGMLLSWTMVHTTYTFHYAFLYYGNDDDQPSTHAGGLNFPEEQEPDYLDFAYFAFVIGMTFQVSDVEITARVIRRKALVHGLLSFGLNTFVVALTVNLVAGLKG